MNSVKKQWDNSYELDGVFFLKKENKCINLDILHLKLNHRKQKGDVSYCNTTRQRNVFISW